MRKNMVWRTIKALAFFVFLIAIAIWIWGNRLEPRWIETVYLDVKVNPIETENSKYKKIRAAFISDMQNGIWLGNTDIFAEVAETIKKEKTDILLIGGDFIYHPTEDDGKKEAKQEWSQEDTDHATALLQDIIPHLEQLITENIIVLAVLGNHDYAMENKSALKREKVAQLVEEKLIASGVKVLKNEVFKFHDVQFGGISPHYPKKDDPQKVFNQFDSELPKVLFMHNANSIRGTSGKNFDFAIAGHTHGGQLRFPGLPNFSWTSLVPHTPDEVYGDGWIKTPHWGKKKVYINRGLGFSTLPLRINCRPEITFIDFNYE